MRKLLALTVILTLAAGCAAAPKAFEARPPRTSGPSAEPTPPSPKHEAAPYLAPPSAFAGARSPITTL
jgi:hypothetical protein